MPKVVQDAVDGEGAYHCQACRAAGSSLPDMRQDISQLCRSSSPHEAASEGQGKPGMDENGSRVNEPIFIKSLVVHRIKLH